MGVFDGMGTVLGSIFGAVATITRKAGGVETVAGAIFRRVTIDDDVGDGRELFVEVPTLRLPANAATRLQPGDLVAMSDIPGAVFRVLDAAAPQTTASDGLVTYRLEERP